MRQTLNRIQHGTPHHIYEIIGLTLPPKIVLSLPMATLLVGPCAERWHSNSSSRMQEITYRIRIRDTRGQCRHRAAAVDRNGTLSETYLADFAARIQSKLKSEIDTYIARVEDIARA